MPLKRDEFAKISSEQYEENRTEINLTNEEIALFEEIALLEDIKRLVL